MAKGKNSGEEKYVPASVHTTPVADSPHKRPAGTDPRVDGPYLDEVRAEQENAYRTLQNMKEEDRSDYAQVYTSARKGTAPKPTEGVALDTRELSDEEIETHNARAFAETPQPREESTPVAEETGTTDERTSVAAEDEGTTNEGTTESSSSSSRSTFSSSGSSSSKGSNK